MKINLPNGVMLLIASLSYLPICYAKPAARVYKMPQTLLQKLKAETKQRFRGECEQKKSELFSNSFYSLPEHKLLILIGLPDYFCSSGSFIPVTVDNQGHWDSGAVIESNPTSLQVDSAQQLWLLSHWEIEGAFPLLHHSSDGINWQEINLPKPTQIDCCFHWLKQMCVAEPQIQIKFTGIDEIQQEDWGTTVNNSLQANPNWQKLSSQQLIKVSQCQTTLLASGDWQRKIVSKGTKIRFQSAAQHMTVIIPHWLK